MSVSAKEIKLINEEGEGLRSSNSWYERNQVIFKRNKLRFRKPTKTSRKIPKLIKQRPL